MFTPIGIVISVIIGAIFLGDEFYLESESLLKVFGENVVWFRNIEWS